MAQFLRPSSDISAGSWTTSPLFSKVNETASNDSPLITSPNNSNTTCDLGLSTASSPTAGTRTLRIRVRKGTQSNNRGLNYNLKQGSTSVQSGTVQATLPTTFTTYSITITGTVTNYSNLSVELISTGTVGGSTGNRAVVDVSWVEFEIPDAPPTYTITGTVGGLLGATSGTATFVGASNDRDITGTVTGLLGSTSGSSTFEKPIFSIDGTVNGLLGSTNGNATFVAPIYEIDGSVLGLLGSVSGSSTFEKPIFTINGDVNGLLGSVSGNAENTVSGFIINGSVSGLLGSADGTSTYELPVFYLNGNLIGLIGVTSGSSTFEPPTFSINGSVQGLLGGASGNAEYTLPENLFTITGSATGLLGTPTGALENTPPNQINGSVTGLMPIVNGNVIGFSSRMEYTISSLRIIGFFE